MVMHMAVDNFVACSGCVFVALDALECFVGTLLDPHSYIL